MFFDLSPRQKEYQAMVEAINGRMKREFHAVHKFLWKSGRGGQTMPPREDIPEGPPDACRYAVHPLVVIVCQQYIQTPPFFLMLWKFVHLFSTTPPPLPPHADITARWRLAK